MKVSELIEELLELKELNGDIEVHVWADHGQNCMEAFAVGTQYVDTDGETLAEEDLDKFNEDDYSKVIEIAG